MAAGAVTGRGGAAGVSGCAQLRRARDNEARRPPQAAPLSFFVRDGAFWFATVAGQRMRNVRANPYASFVVTEGEDDAHRVVMAEGAVNVHQPTEALRTEWAARHGSVPTWAAAMLELVPERVFSYGPQTGDSPPPIGVALK